MTAVDALFKMKCFTSQLQRDNVKQYIVFDSLKTNYKIISNDSLSSSSNEPKRMKTRKLSLNQSNHWSIKDCFDKVVAGKCTNHSWSSKRKNAFATGIEINLNVKNISRPDNSYTLGQVRKDKFSCLVKLSTKYLLHQ